MRQIYCLIIVVIIILQFIVSTFRISIETKTKVDLSGFTAVPKFATLASGFFQAFESTRATYTQYKEHRDSALVITFYFNVANIVFVFVNLERLKTRLDYLSHINFCGDAVAVGVIEIDYVSGVHMESVNVRGFFKFLVCTELILCLINSVNKMSFAR